MSGHFKQTGGILMKEMTGSLTNLALSNSSEQRGAGIRTATESVCHKHTNDTRSLTAVGATRNLPAKCCPEPFDDAKRRRKKSTKVPITGVRYSSVTNSDKMD